MCKHMHKFCCCVHNAYTISAIESLITCSNDVNASQRKVHSHSDSKVDAPIPFSIVVVAQLVVKMFKIQSTKLKNWHTVRKNSVLIRNYMPNRKLIGKFICVHCTPIFLWSINKDRVEQIKIKYFY